MTKIIYSRYNGDIYFECKGHSGYRNPDPGNNDVCVMISTLCSMIVRYIDSRDYAPKICEDGHVKIEIQSSDKQIQEVFNAVMIEFSAIADYWPTYVKVY